MADNFETLLTTAEEIRTNELPESNTAALVGGLLVDLINETKKVSDNVDDTSVSIGDKSEEENDPDTLWGQIHDIRGRLSDVEGTVPNDLGIFKSITDFKNKINTLYQHDNVGRYIGVIDLTIYKFPFYLQVSVWGNYTFQSLLINCSLSDLNNNVILFSSSGDRLFVRRFSGEKPEEWRDNLAELVATTIELSKSLSDAKAKMATTTWIEEQNFITARPGKTIETQDIIPDKEDLPPDAAESPYSLGADFPLRRWLAIYVKEVVAETIGRLDKKLTIQAIDLLLNADGWIQCLQNLRFGRNYNSTDEPKYGIDVGGDANFQSVSIKGSPIIQSVYLTAEEYQNLVNNGEVKEDVEYNIYE